MKNKVVHVLQIKSAHMIYKTVKSGYQLFAAESSEFNSPLCSLNNGHIANYVLKSFGWDRK